MQTYHIFGDTGAHYTQLKNALQKIGVNTNTHKIPENTTIIHLGDLIHKGPNTPKTLQLVTKLIKNNPNQWVQIIGNHEAQHLSKKHPYFWRCENCTPHTIETLQQLHQQGHLKTAHGINNINPQSLQLNNPTGPRPPKTLQHGNTIFTHGGITHQWWATTGKQITAAEQLANHINNLPDQITGKPGTLLGQPNPHVGPIWAIANSEVYPSWTNPAATPLPFNIIHGHTRSYDHINNRWFPYTPKNFRQNTTINLKNHTTATQINNSYIIGCDPGYETHPTTPTQPYTTFTTP